MMLPSLPRRAMSLLNTCLALCSTLFLRSTLSGCGGGSGSPAPISSTSIKVSISPTAAIVRLNASQAFTASVQNATTKAVTWSVQEGNAGGTITALGVYTAPSTAGVYHVVAASKVNPTVTAVAAVTVPINVSVQPAATTLTLGFVKV